MKRLLILILAILTLPFSHLYGQNQIPDDFVKRLKELLNNPQIADSVLVGDSIKEKTISFSSEFVKGHLFLLRQDYSLYDKKKKTYYGYNGNDQFGMTYTLGLRCKGFNILLDEAIHPWVYDANYKEFQEKRLEPVITSSHYLLFNDSVNNGYVEMDSVVCAKQTIRENFFYASSPFVSMQDGFTLNTADTCKTGFLVWVVNEGGDIETGQFKMDLKYSIVKAEMFGSINIVPPVASDSIIGGFYLTGSGNKDCPYLLTGIAIMRDERWTINFPFKGFKFETSPEKKEKGRLTEIKKPIKVVEKN